MDISPWLGGRDDVGDESPFQSVCSTRERGCYTGVYDRASRDRCIGDLSVTKGVIEQRRAPLLCNPSGRCPCGKEIRNRVEQEQTELNKTERESVAYITKTNKRPCPLKISPVYFQVQDVDARKPRTELLPHYPHLREDRPS